jgi:hypothetical protein
MYVIVWTGEGYTAHGVPYKLPEPNLVTQHVAYTPNYLARA